MSFFLFPIHTHAQKNNAEIYRDLLKEIELLHPQSFKSIEGRYFKDYLPELMVDSSEQDVLQINGFSIVYNPLGKGSYLRDIQIPINIAGKDENLVYQDTLSGNTLRKVIKKSPEVFKGEDPTTFSRWLKPAAMISASVLGIIGLFFIRSG
ncbi:MAG: hypothetical protein AAFY45_20275 [Bacteroidota bacterium]